MVHYSLILKAEIHRQLDCNGHFRSCNQASNFHLWSDLVVRDCLRIGLEM